MQVFYAAKMRRFMGFCIKRMIINLLRCSFAVCLKLKKKRKKMLTRKYAKFIF